MILTSFIRLQKSIAMLMNKIKIYVSTKRILLGFYWNGDVDLEVVIRWYAITYLL
jgi:hypothetical protein